MKTPMSPPWHGKAVEHAFRHHSAKFRNFVGTLFCLLLFSCNNNNNNPPSAPPNPTIASVALKVQNGGSNNQPYVCAQGAPGDLINQGLGALRLNVNGQNPMNFILDYFFTPSTFSFPTVTNQNNTQRAAADGFIQVGGASNNNDRLVFSVPFSDSYSLKFIYIEYGSGTPNCCGNFSSCSPPAAEQCRRWVKMLDFASGSIPSSNNEIVSIDVQDPTGFVGNCE